MTVGKTVGGLHLTESVTAKTRPDNKLIQELDGKLEREMKTPTDQKRFTVGDL
jgi:hypothetical protein